ncbi:MAG: CPBP family glutamic-type intramembrane protease, partial [Ignavibacteria bacterium]|nr:CPBP family glutamic-type intramembrane protease [Ignavibacteria bacterium]
MKKDIQFGFSVVIAFAAYYLMKEWFFSSIYHSITAFSGSKIIAYLISYLTIGTPLFLGVLIHFKNSFFSSLGLDKSFLLALLAAFILTSPMLIGYAIMYPFNNEVTTFGIVRGALFAAFFEEVYFRGFFFGLLFRFTRLGFIASILLGALTFASFHLYQSNDPVVMTGIFITTLLGAGLFAWTYIEWNNNLWVSIHLHLLMNLYWMLFSAGDNALGGLTSNIFRGLT